jgi:exosortase A
MSAVTHQSGLMNDGPDRSDLRFMLGLAVALLLLWILLFHDTIWSLVSMWARSETFMHGFLIFPLSAYLIYVRRDSLRGVPIEPYPPAIAILFPLGVIWFAGWSAGAEVVQQFAIIAILVTLVVIALGLRFARKISGPLAYLFFAVPFGEILIYPLREFTAGSIMAGLNLTGISVVRSGFYLSTSAGDFAVERACSGLRYLIASFALGTLFAMLYLTSTRRRVIFIALSLIVPVLANGIRAYLIVVLAHLSSLKIAAGVDHIIYGWIFFGIVMLLLFWFGARMEDRASKPGAEQASEAGERGGVSRRNWVLTAGLTVLILSTGPAAAYFLEKHESGQSVQVAKLPELGGWKHLPLAESSWVPAFAGRVEIDQGSYEPSQTGRMRVDAAIASYGETHEAGALIGYGNRTIDSKAWHESMHLSRTVVTDSGENVVFSVVEAESPVTGRRRVIWYSYVIGSTAVDNDYVGKALQAWTRIASPGRALWSFAFSAESNSPDVDLNAAVEEFVRENFAKLSSVQPDAARN